MSLKMVSLPRSLARQGPSDTLEGQRPASQDLNSAKAVPLSHRKQACCRASNFSSDWKTIHTEALELNRRSALGGLTLALVSFGSFPLNSLAEIALDADASTVLASSDSMDMVPEKDKEVCVPHDHVASIQSLDEWQGTSEATSCVKPESSTQSVPPMHASADAPSPAVDSSSVIVYASFGAGTTIAAAAVDAATVVASAADAAGVAAGAAATAGGVVVQGTSAVASTAASVSAATSVGAKDVVLTSLKHLGGGSVAGAVGATVVYPLDTVKTRMQAQEPVVDAEEQGEDFDGKRLAYKDELDCLRRVIQEEGIGSLYSGLGAQLIGVAPEKAIKLAVNELLLQQLESYMPGARIWALEFIAGGGGGLSQVVFTNPVEVVKVRQQTSHSQQAQHHKEGEEQGSALQGTDAHLVGSQMLMRPDLEPMAHPVLATDASRKEQSEVPSEFQCARATLGESVGQGRRPNERLQAFTPALSEAGTGVEQTQSIWQLVRELGLPGLYMGSMVTILRDVPGTSIFFGLYALLKQTVYPDSSFLAGFVAAIPAAFLVTPMDVVKTRMQMEPVPGKPQFTNAWECFEYVYKNEGMKGLFKGGLIRVLRMSPQFGITLMLYDFLCR